MSLYSHVFLSFSQELDRTSQLLNEKELDMTGLVNEKELGRTRHELDNHSSCELEGLDKHNCCMRGN